MWANQGRIVFCLRDMGRIRRGLRVPKGEGFRQWVWVAGRYLSLREAVPILGPELGDKRQRLQELIRLYKCRLPGFKVGLHHNEENRIAYRH